MRKTRHIEADIHGSCRFSLVGSGPCDTSGRQPHDSMRILLLVKQMGGPAGHLPRDFRVDRAMGP